MSAHGTPARYQHGGCRCDACRTAFISYGTHWRRRHRYSPNTGFNKWVPERDAEGNKVRKWIYRNHAKPSTCEDCGCDPGVDAAGRSNIYVYFPGEPDSANYEWLCTLCHGRRRWTTTVEAAA